MLRVIAIFLRVILIYCNPVWGAANDTVLNPLIVFQKKIIRVISFKRRYEHTRPLFVELKILTIKQINKYMSGLCVHKSLRSNNNFFTRYESAVYNTRLSNRNTVVIPNIVSKHSRQSVRWVGCSVWNSIPQILRDTDSYQGFKIKFKHNLMATEATWPRSAAYDVSCFLFFFLGVFFSSFSLWWLGFIW